MVDPTPGPLDIEALITAKRAEWAERVRLDIQALEELEEKKSQRNRARAQFNKQARDAIEKVHRT
jgi:hypothetical protein